MENETKENSEGKKRGPNFSASEKSLLLNILQGFKDIIENKKTDAMTWRDKDLAWDKITDMFNCQALETCPRTKESLRKFYSNMKKHVRKEVAEEKREIRKTGGGPSPNTGRVDPTKDLILNLVNEKTVVGLHNPFDGDSIEITTEAGPPKKKQCLQNASLNQSYVLRPNEDNSHIICEDQINEQPSLDWSNIPASQLATPKTKELQHTWTKRRRPNIQQQASSKLAEEYSALAKLKLDLYKMEKENLHSREERERELFKLNKKKLELEIYLIQLEIKNKEARVFN